MLSTLSFGKEFTGTERKEIMTDKSRELIENAFNKVEIRDRIYDFSGIMNLFPNDYKEFLSVYNGGAGNISENAYLHLWEYEKIEEFNNDYESSEFLTDIILIGSDGGDTAYGINKNGQFIEVLFIGMDNDEVTIIENSFTDFIIYLNKR